MNVIYKYHFRITFLKWKSNNFFHWLELIHAYIHITGHYSTIMIIIFLCLFLFQILKYFYFWPQILRRISTNKVGWIIILTVRISVSLLANQNWILLNNMIWFGNFLVLSSPIFWGSKLKEHNEVIAFFI